MSNAAVMRLNAIETIRKHWGWFLALGIVFVVGGIFAIFAPGIASLTVTLVFAIVFVWLGIMQIIQAFGIKSWGSFVWQLLVGLVFLLGGIAIWVDPILGALSLTIIVAAVFLAKGVFQLILGFQMRPGSGWGWMVTSGVLAIIVGLMIWLSGPSRGPGCSARSPASR